MKKPLHFNENGKFKIVQFTDLHWKNGDEHDMQTRSLMELVLQEERPDLVVFTGDVIYSESCIDPLQSMREAISTADQSGIPWAVVLGNHDAEKNVTREELLHVLTEYDIGLTGHTPGVSGFGNYSLTVTGKDESDAAVLYFLDSGDYPKLPHVEGYDWISRDQIDWYLSEANAFKEKNSGQPLPSLAFFHIPLQEYYTAWERQVCYGNKFENICCSQINSGLFGAMVEMGDVIGTFVGHDHINDYYGSMLGIRLCYGRATGYNTYGKDGFPRGARVIELTEGERKFESWLRLDDGSVDLQLNAHEPEGKI